MTTYTLETANSILSQSKIPFLLLPEGFNLLKTKSRFVKALEFCLSNAAAKNDVTNFLDHYKTDPRMVSSIASAEPTQKAPRLQSPEEQEALRLRQQPTQQPTQQRTVNQEQSAPHDIAPVNESFRADPNDRFEEPPQGGTEQNRNFDGHHIYGKSFALYVAVDVTRGEDATIRIEGAKATGPKKFDWGSKLALQITRGDLPTVAAVFFGLLPECELKHYGADNSKRLTIKNQGKNFFINMSAKDFPQIAVPISASDVFEIRALFLQQLLANRPSIGVEGMLANLKLHAVMLKAN